MVKGQKVKIDGYADELGIADYGTVRVLSFGTIAETPCKYAKKVLVTIDDIDGDCNVTTYVKTKGITDII